MGKSKPRKVKRRRPKPTVVPSIKELENEEELIDGNADLNAVFSVLEKLQSVSSEDKECGASIVARMSENTDFISQFIENDGLRILAPLLVDANISVRHTTCGSLRNLSCSGDHRVCGEMVKQDVLSPLVALLKQFSSHWTPSKSPKCKIDSRKEIFIEACHLLSYLCESSDIAVETFNRNNLVSILLPCLSLQTYGIEVVLAVAECLHTITEDNDDVVKKIGQKDRDVLRSFMQLVPDQPAHVYLRVLASGVILNLAGGKIDACGPAVAADIINVADNVLQIAVQEDIEKFANDVHCYKETKKDKYRDSEELQTKFSVLESNLNIMQSVVTSKKIALEMLTNICCNDENDGDWDDSSSASEEMTNVEENPSCSVNFGLDLPCEVQGLIVNKEIVQKVLQQIVIPSEKIATLFAEIPQGKEYFKRLHTMRCRALFCINNIVQGLSIEELGGTLKVFQLFMDLSVLVFSQTDPSDTEQLQAATSSVRATLQKLSEADAAAHLGKMTENDLKLFCNMWEKCQDASTRVNILRSMATVACILVDMKQENSHALITCIGSFLIDTAVKSPELWVTAEALDAIFDVFSEDHLDYIAQNIDLVTKLKLMLPALKIKIKQQRSSSGEHHLVIMTAKNNLARFLKYKENYRS